MLTRSQSRPFCFVTSLRRHKFSFLHSIWQRAGVHHSSSSGCKTTFPPLLLYEGYVFLSPLGLPNSNPCFSLAVEKVGSSILHSAAGVGCICWVKSPLITTRDLLCITGFNLLTFCEDFLSASLSIKDVGVVFFIWGTIVWFGVLG